MPPTPTPFPLTTHSSQLVPTQPWTWLLRQGKPQVVDWFSFGPFKLPCLLLTLPYPTLPILWMNILYPPRPHSAQTGLGLCPACRRYPPNYRPGHDTSGTGTCQPSHPCPVLETGRNKDRMETDPRQQTPPFLPPPACPRSAVLVLFPTPSLHRHCATDITYPLPFVVEQLDLPTPTLDWSDSNLPSPPASPARSHLPPYLLLWAFWFACPLCPNLGLCIGYQGQTNFWLFTSDFWDRTNRHGDVLTQFHVLVYTHHPTPPSQLYGVKQLIIGQKHSLGQTWGSLPDSFPPHPTQTSPRAFSDNSLNRTC